MSDISLNEVLKSLRLYLTSQQIYLFCENEEVSEEFCQKFYGDLFSNEEIEIFFRKHSKDINVERLLVVLAQNYKQKMEENNNEMAAIRQRLVFKRDDMATIEARKIEQENRLLKNQLNEAVKFLKNIEPTLTFYIQYDPREKRSKVKVMDTREFTEPEKHSKRIEGKKRRFDKIDHDFKSGDKEQELGLEFVFQFLILTDLYEVFPSREFGDNIRTMIGDNAIIKNGLKTKSELSRIKNTDSRDEYDRMLDQLKFEDMLTDIKYTLREYAYYLDIDKLLLIAAYKAQNALENGSVKGLQSANSIKIILTTILKNIEDRKTQISCDLLIKRQGNYEAKSVQYSVKDLEEGLKRFTSKGFITSEDLQQYLEKLNNGEITLEQLELEYGQITFLNEKMDELALASPENFIYVSRQHGWDTKKIMQELNQMDSCSAQILQEFIEDKKIGVQEVIQLYQAGVIGIEVVQDLKSIIDLSNSVSSETVAINYRATKENPEDEDALNQYQKSVALYKAIHIDDKSEKEKEEVSNLLMLHIIETFEEDYEDAVKEYFRNGLITIDSIIEGNEESFVIKLYNEGIISLQDLEDAIRKGKLPERYIREIYEDEICNSNLSQEQRVEMLLKGWVSKETIERLFGENLINKDDLRRLVEKNVITEEEKSQIIESLSIEEAEANSPIILAIDNDIRKVTGKDRSAGSTNYNYSTSGPKKKIIISPNAREEFFRLLGAKKATTTQINEDNPFYNYQFYVIPGKDGKIHLNSPVIAERYFEDKDTERVFATENATYFFQYGDLMVLSRYAQKDEVVGKKENVVFRSNHTIANPNKRGNWASSVIGNIVRTLLSSDLKEYSRDHQLLITLAKIKEIYTIEEIMAIFSLQSDIDEGKHLYEVINEKIAPNFDDSDGDER